MKFNWPALVLSSIAWLGLLEPAGAQDLRLDRLLERVGPMVKAGKSLEEIKRDVRMPEYANWASQDRFPTNVDAAYRMLEQP